MRGALRNVPVTRKSPFSKGFMQASGLGFSLKFSVGCRLLATEAPRLADSLPRALGQPVT